MVRALKVSLVYTFVIWYEWLELAVGSLDGDIMNFRYKVRFGVTS